MSPGEVIDSRDHFQVKTPLGKVTWLNLVVLRIIPESFRVCLIGLRQNKDMVVHVSLFGSL